MVAVNSTMLPLGTRCPDFRLPDGAGNVFSRDSIAAGRPLVVAFLSNHCPFVKHLKTELAAFGRDAQAKGASMVAIASNDVERYPADSPELMVEDAATFGYTFPYLYDADQTVAEAFKAACTPDFYIFDATGALAYRGQFDETRPNSGTPTGSDLRAALDAIVAGADAPSPQIPSIGCNIKWKPGNEPSYFG